MAQWVKNLPAMQVQTIGQTDPLEEGMATHTSMHARRISWTEEPGGLQSIGSQRIGQDWSYWARTYVHTYTHTHTHYKQKQSNQWSPQSFLYHSPRTLSIHHSSEICAWSSLHLWLCALCWWRVYLPMEPAEIQVPWEVFAPSKCLTHWKYPILLWFSIYTMNKPTKACWSCLILTQVFSQVFFFFFFEEDHF